MVRFSTGAPNIKRNMSNVKRTSMMNSWSVRKVWNMEIWIKKPLVNPKQLMRLKHQLIFSNNLKAGRVSKYQCSKVEVNDLWLEVVQNSLVK